VLRTEPEMSDWPQADDATVAALARQTRLGNEVVKRIYNEELAALHSRSRVKSFVRVIAGRRAKRRLMDLSSTAPLVTAALTTDKV